MRTIFAFILGAVLAAGISAVAQTNPCGPSSESYYQPRVVIPQPGDTRNCFQYGAFTDCR